MMTQNQKSLALYAAAGILLSIPFFAMKFTDAVNWAGSDFLIAAFLLFGTAAGLDLVFRKVKYAKNRILISLAILVALFLIWAELAVGLFGTPFAGS